MQDIDFNNIRRMDGSLLLVFHELLREKRATAVAQVRRRGPTRALSGRLAPRHGGFLVLWVWVKILRSKL